MRLHRRWMDRSSAGGVEHGLLRWKGLERQQ
uniref:Uncharacterized protein n=1 Tax=Arundo donax TaxID=35708 RepID=A0A0A8XRC3_ARUDO